MSRNIQQVCDNIKGLNASAAQIVNVTGTPGSENMEGKVSDLVDKMSLTLDDLVTNLMVISSTMEEEENALDSLDKLLEGIEIFFASTSPEVVKSNEVIIVAESYQ